MNGENDTTRERLRQDTLRLNSGAVGFSAGVLFGVILFVATLWLVVKGGSQIGPHLGLLNHFLPGYSVSIAGSFIGLFYGFAIGTMGGSAVCWIYNRIVSLQRHLGTRDD